MSPHPVPRRASLGPALGSLPARVLEPNCLISQIPATYEIQIEIHENVDQPTSCGYHILGMLAGHYSSDVLTQEGRLNSFINSNKHERSDLHQSSLITSLVHNQHKTALSPGPVAGQLGGELFVDTDTSSKSRLKSSIAAHFFFQAVASFDTLLDGTAFDFFAALRLWSSRSNGSSDNKTG